MYIICLHILFWSYFHNCEAMTLCSIKLLEIGCRLDVTWLKTATTRLSFNHPHSVQAQLIHDRNTASHSTVNDKAAGATPDRVHMTWTKDKLVQERTRHREGMGVKDMFNMRP